MTKLFDGWMCFWKRIKGPDVSRVGFLAERFRHEVTKEDLRKKDKKKDWDLRFSFLITVFIRCISVYIWL